MSTDLIFYGVQLLGLFFIPADIIRKGSGNAFAHEPKCLPSSSWRFILVAEGVIVNEC